MSFHRFVDPSYYLGGGSFPGTIFGHTYDYVNVVSGGVGAGGSAQADNAKSGGPNTGTYWHAFGEDATSNFFNRGFKALVENTDYLDDLVHRDVAVPTRTADVVATGDTSVLLPIGTWVGDSPSTPIQDLFAIVDEYGMHISLATTGAYVTPASIVGAVIGDGFSTGAVTLNFSMAITALMSPYAWHVVYGIRSNLAVMPTGSLVWPAIKASEELHGLVQNVIKLIKGRQTDVSQWGDTPTKNLYDVAYSGLDDMYRLRQTVPFSTPTWYPKAAVLNTAAAGGWFNKDSYAMAGRASASGTGVSGTLGQIEYALGAVWHASCADALVASAYTHRISASSGFVTFGRSGRSWDDVLDGATPHPMNLFGLGHFSRRSSYNTKSTTLSTVLVEGSVFTGSAPDCLAAPANNWFGHVTYGTAIQLGLDVLSFVDGSGNYWNLVVVDFDDETNVFVRCVDGSSPNFSGATALTLVAWLAPTFVTTDNAPAIMHQRFSDTYAGIMGGNGNVMSSLPPVYEPTAHITVPTLSLWGSDLADDTPVLLWGGHDALSYGALVDKGTLFADGGARFSGVVDVSPPTWSTIPFIKVSCDHPSSQYLTVMEAQMLHSSALYGMSRHLVRSSDRWDTFNAGWVNTDWVPDSIARSAFACGIDADGPFICSKFDTSGGSWSTWDSLNAAVGLGYQWIVFSSSDTVTDHTGGSGLEQITRSSSPSGTLTVTFPKAMAGHVLEAHASISVTSTVISKIILASLLYRVNGGTWEIVPGSRRAHEFTDLLGTTIHLFGVQQLTGIGVQTDVEVSVWVDGQVGSSYEFNLVAGTGTDTILRAKLYRLSD